MGMESFYLELIPTDVSISYVNDVRKFEGKSDLSSLDFYNSFVKINLPINSKKDNSIIIDKAIHLQIIEKEQKVQTILLQGCFTWFIESLPLCYTVVRFIKSNIFDVKLNILGEEIQADDYDSFQAAIIDLYKEKYEYFNTHLANFRAKILPSDFYKYRKNYLRKKNNIFSKLSVLFRGGTRW